MAKEIEATIIRRKEKFDWLALSLVILILSMNIGILYFLVAYRISLWDRIQLGVILFVYSFLLGMFVESMRGEWRYEEESRENVIIEIEKSKRVN